MAGGGWRSLRVRGALQAAAVQLHLQHGLLRARGSGEPFQRVVRFEYYYMTSYVSPRREKDDAEDAHTDAVEYDTTAAAAAAAAEEEGVK